MASCNSNGTSSTVNDLSAKGIISMSIYVLATVSHMVGIVLLVRLRDHLNQILIIKNLVTMEIIASLNYTISLFRKVLVTKVLKVPNMALTVFSELGIRLFMVGILADRFLEIYLNIKYPVIITRGRVFKLICLVWVTSGIYGLGHTISAALEESTSSSWYIHNYVNGVADVIFTISATITYSYFYLKIKEIRSKDTAQGCNGVSNRHFNYKIPFMIVGTFLTFNVTSDILFQICQYKITHCEGCCTSCGLFEPFAYVFQASGYLADAVIYVAMQKNIKTFFRRRVQPHDEE